MLLCFLNFQNFNYSDFSLSIQILPPNAIQHICKFRESASNAQNTKYELNVLSNHLSIFQIPKSYKPSLPQQYKNLKLNNPNFTLTVCTPSDDHIFLHFLSHFGEKKISKGLDRDSNSRPAGLKLIVLTTTPWKIDVDQGKFSINKLNT